MSSEEQQQNDVAEENRRGQGFVEGRGGEPSEAQRAFRRLAIVLGVVAGIIIYAYGWTVTEIDLERPQEEQRQENVTRALRELLSPRLFEQKRDVVDLEAPVLMVEDTATCSNADVPQQADLDNLEAASDGAAVVEPACVASGDEITVRVGGASGNADARIRWLPPAEEDGEVRPRPREILETEREDFVLSSSGTFSGTIEVPRIRGGEGQIHTVQVRVAVPAGPIQLSETSQLVIDRIAETIFMALVATTVAIPIAAILSFFAARNLMQQVRMSVGSALMAFIAFVIGIYLGTLLVEPLGKAAVNIGRGDFDAVFAAFDGLGMLLAGGILMVAGVLSSIRERLLGDTEPRDPAVPSRSQVVINTVLFTLLVVLVIGLIGGLAILIGGAIMDFGEGFQPQATETLSDDITNAIAVLVISFGRLLDIIGTVLDLFIGGIAALLAGFALATIAGSLLGSAQRRVPATLNHALGMVMGGLGGALLLAILAQAALWASLLGLLPLLAASVLGGGLFFQLIRNGLQAAGQTRLRQRLHGRTSQAQVIRLAIFGTGMLVTGIYVFNELNLGRTLVDGTLPTQSQQTILGVTLPLEGYVFEAALIGAVLAGITGGLVGVRSVFPLGNVLYSVSRLSMNIVRSIEPLIMGLVFVIWVGIGPFAGVLALTLHSIAALGKLYSEQIENIDEGPLEALRSTGANQLQTIIYAVVPQIIPPYIAFTMYRWDINVRMSTIIGFVGGGGIGLLLQQQINLLRYRDAGVAVLAIAVVVSILDYASALIRERVT